MEDEDLKNSLRASGLRATRARVRVLQHLHGRTRPTSHPEVHQVLAEEGWDRATLYRNLIDLTEAGLVRRVNVGDSVWRFELKTTPTDGAHPHFLCTACGSITCLPQIPLPTEGMPKSITSGEATLQIQGVCDDCHD